MSKKTIDKSIASVQLPANDPFVPLVLSRNIPGLPSPCPPFTVQGFTGKDGVAGSLEHLAAVTYTFIVHGLKAVGERMSNPPSRWARTKTLVVQPRAGRQLNAYYDGASLRFFYASVDGKTLYTCESSDIVSHELGHAVLDILRPDLWSVQSVETMAFHESFGDMLAIVATLCHDEVVDFVIRETNGDLSRSNIVSRVAEELGHAVYYQPDKNTAALRNAANEFKYVNPTTLPSDGPPTVLARECHNFSRVFTGAFYDLIVNQYIFNVRTMAPAAALKLARDQVATVLFNGVTHAANVSKFFYSVARAMVLTDKELGGKCAESLASVFGSRNLLEVPPKAASAVVAMDISNAKTVLFGNITSVRVGGTRSVKLIEEMILPQSDNPLYGVDIDIPHEHYLELTNDGTCEAEIPVDRVATLTSAKLCLDDIHESKRVSYEEDDDDKEFVVADGKLVRNFICCRHNRD